MFIIKVLVLVSVDMKFAFGLNNFANIACGVSHSRTGKVVGGSDAVPHEFPWMVSLSRRGSHFCGGSLITDRYILTAGHCLCTGIGEELISPAKIKISVAQHDLESSADNAFEMAVDKIMVHPEYSCKKVKHDLAIIRVTGKIPWSTSVAPVCLPSASGQDSYNKFSNTTATVAGWGWTNENRGTGKRASILQKGKVHILENETCRIWYQSQAKKTKIQGGQLCAGHEQGGVDACWADSGGPLMVQSHGQAMIVGVVSTGIGCARPLLPGIYTRISEYVPWIRSTLDS